MPAAESNGDVMDVHQNGIGSTSDLDAVDDRKDMSCDVDHAVCILFSDFVPLHPWVRLIMHRINVLYWTPSSNLNPSRFIQ